MRSAMSGRRLAARVSIQVMAGRTGTPDASSSTTVCICPERPMPITSAPGTSASTARVAATQAAHQSSTDCSAQPAAGAVVGYDALRTARVRPSRSSSSALRLDEPRSRPRSV
jgi:hypothetical protein